MRVIPALLLALALTTSCSTDEPAKESPNVAKWKAGNAVVVVTADLAAGTDVDVEALGRRPGVISASVASDRLKVALSRQAMLVDLGALKADLTKTQGVSNVREAFTTPTG
jgi:hypothetical protein